MKWNKYKIVCIAFLAFIISTGLFTAIFGAKQIGYNMLIGYKDKLDENPTNLEKLKAIIAGCEDGMNTEYVLKDQCINLYTGFQRLLDKRVVKDIEPDNDVIKLNNGYLSFYEHQKINSDESVSNILEFNNFLEEREIPLLYIQAPYKISKYDNQTPIGIKAYNNENADDYLKKISKVGIDNIDLRELIKKDGIEHYSMFFKTDHHWTPKAGLWAFEKIAKELNLNYGFDIDKKLWNKENYNVQTYENCFLGSQGKRTGIYYAGLDDFDIITPKFETDFEFNIKSKNICRTGEFKETLLDLDYFENCLKTQDYFNSFVYDTYINGDHGFVNIKNKKNDSGKKILLIKDSFSCVVAPFLAQGCSNLDIVDLRQSDSIDLKEYMDNNEPDIVIVMYCTTRKESFID